MLSKAYITKIGNPSLSFISGFKTNKILVIPQTSNLKSRDIPNKFKTVPHISIIPANIPRPLLGYLSQKAFNLAKVSTSAFSLNRSTHRPWLFLGQKDRDSPGSHSKRLPFSCHTRKPRIKGTTQQNFSNSLNAEDSLPSSSTTVCWWRRDGTSFGCLQAQV